MQLHLARPEDAEDLLGVHRADDELLPDLDVVALAHEQPGPLGHRVGDLLGAVVGDDDELAGLLGVLDPDPAGGLLIGATPLGVRASNSSTTRGRPWVMSSPATPPVWNVRMVSWVPGSPIDCAAMMPTASPTSTSLPEAIERP